MGLKVPTAAFEGLNGGILGGSSRDRLVVCEKEIPVPEIQSDHRGWVNNWRVREFTLIRVLLIANYLVGGA